MDFNLSNFLMVLFLIILSFLFIAMGIGGLITTIKFILHGPIDISF